MHSSNPQNILSTRIDSLFSEYRCLNCPGAALFVIKDEKIITRKFYGFADIDKKIKVKSTTNFRLASVTKQFTAAAVLILISENKLSFTDRLTDLFENFPQYGSQIKIENLLNHTSGLIDYEDLIPDSATVQVKDHDVLEILKKQDSLYFEPGTEFRYSNTAYALLALIIERVSGMSFARFLKEKIFTPLEMFNSVAHEEGISVVKERAFGY
jgi:CubicO group peptidase (beta-lactamase class C family)